MNRLASRVLGVAAVLCACAALVFGVQDNQQAQLLAGIAAIVCLAASGAAANPLPGAATASWLGALVALYLTRQHLVAQSGGSSVCNFNDTFNCDVVNTSAASELFGVSVALYGFAFYAALGVEALRAMRKPEKYPGIGGVLFAGGLLAAGFSAYLASASYALGTWCLLCMTLYALNVILLVTGFQASRHGGEAAGLPALLKNASASNALLTGFVVFLLAMFGYSIEEKAASPTGVAESGGIELMYEQVDGKVTINGDEPVWGHSDAPYTLVEFADYECPHCAEMAKEVKKLVAAHPELRVIHKHYPLSNICNPSIPDTFHTHACMAAAAATCAHAQGHFWELSNKLFENQAFLEADDIRYMAEQVGLDTTALDACMSSPATADLIHRDAAEGKDAGVWSTPSLFLKDVVQPGEFVRVTMGAEGVDLMLRWKAAGTPFPPARPPSRGP